MDLQEAMRARHSVRSYTDRPIPEQLRIRLEEEAAACNAQGDLRIRLLTEEPKAFGGMMAHYGKSSGVKNYIALVGKKSPKLEEALGYYGEKIVLNVQELGLNSCWVAMTHGKSQADVRKGEKQICLIAFGHGETQGAPHKNKPLQAVCNRTENMPEWFLNGMEAALLAPTAMNQQKFFFELFSDSKVNAVCGKGFYTKLDLGIVKYHFEIASGRKLQS